MDGTLLDTHTTIPQENVEAILHLQNLGIPFIICTGRTWEEANVVLKPAGIKCPIIATNGADTYDIDGTLLYRIALDKKQVTLILEQAEKENLYVELTTSDGVYTTNAKRRGEQFLKTHKQLHPEKTEQELQEALEQFLTLLATKKTASFSALLANPTIDVLKILISDPAGQEKFIKLKQFIHEQIPEFVITSSYFDNIEITHHHAQKGIALAAYAKKNNWDMQHVVAVGDNHNDISMLELAGHSYAMGNADEVVKQIAKHTTTKNTEAGVAKMIYHYFPK